MVKTEQVVETVARMNKEEREQFVRTMVYKWSDMAQDISNAIEIEIYNKKNYG